MKSDEWYMLYDPVGTVPRTASFELRIGIIRLFQEVVKEKKISTALADLS